MVQIRRARAEDAPALTAIARAAYAPYVAAIGREPAPMLADFPALIAAGHVRVAGGAEPLGYVVAYPDGTAWHLENVAVAPDAHGRGVGKALIADVERRAAAAGAEAVELYTNAKMTRNLSMYPALGYVGTGRRHEAGFDRVFFRKPLSGTRA